MELPKNDIYVKLLELATNLNDKPDPQKGKIGCNLKVGAKIKIDESISDSYEELPENYYVVKKIFKEKNGLLAIIVEREYEDESGNAQKEGILALGGSFSVKEPYKNPVEWYKDWVLNNAKIALNKIPPQFYTALGILDKYKAEYNIKSITGFSLGAVLGGMLAKFNRHSDVNAYLYNGGLPVELEKVLKKVYDAQINPDSSNILTMLTQGDLLTNLITVERGSGIFLSGREEKIHCGHEISSHRKLTASDYTEIIQKGSISTDELSTAIDKTSAGVSVQLNIPLPNKPYKKKLSEIEDEKNNEINISDKRVIKEMPKTIKSKVKSLEYFNDFSDNNESENDLLENTELNSNYPAASNEEKSYNAEDLLENADSVPQSSQSSEWSSKVLENGDKVYRTQYANPDYGSPVTREVRKKKKKYPSSYFELYEVVEDIVVSLLDDFIRFIGYDEVHKL